MSGLVRSECKMWDNWSRDPGFKIRTALFSLQRDGVLCVCLQLLVYIMWYEGRGGGVICESARSEVRIICPPNTAEILLSPIYIYYTWTWSHTHHYNSDLFVSNQKSQSIRKQFIVLIKFGVQMSGRVKDIDRAVRIS